MAKAWYKLVGNVKAAIGLVALLWLIHLASFALPLNSFGIQPRTAAGLIGIFCAPFLHESWGHLIANSTMLFSLVLTALLYDEKLALRSMAIIMAVAGVGTWALGAPRTNHIGASSIVFGLLGYLIFLGWYRRKPGSIVISLGILFLYGWTLTSLLSVSTHISWSGHFFGFVGGVLAAKDCARYGECIAG